jgi:hypothetical protein
MSILRARKFRRFVLELLPLAALVIEDVPITSEVTGYLSAVANVGEGSSSQLAGRISF